MAEAPGTALDVEVDGERHRVPAGAEWLIGRADEAQLQLTDRRVSRRHAVLRSGRTGWVLEDISANGTWADGDRVQELAIAGAVTVHLGGADGVAVRLEPVAQPVDPQPVDPQPVDTQPVDTQPSLPEPRGQLEDAGPSAIHRLSGVLRIGRSGDNDVVVDDLQASRHHAELHRTAAGVEIRDLGSGNGTFLNGAKVSRAQITRGDLVTVGNILLRFDGERLLEYVDTGDVTFAAAHLRVDLPGGKRILDDVSFQLPPRSLMAVVGPSGAGKSTLLGALTGSRPATSGRVFYAGRDLYGGFDELRQRIGLVPQQDIIHTPLTVEQALRFGADLRFPVDVSSEERRRRVDEVLGELGLSAQRRQRIDTLSGGQRKRVSVALELLTKPSLLFLDEPTSGLDPGLDKSVMTMLRGLADEGRTVVVVTHSVAFLELCDLVMVLAPGGHVAYLGPPADAPAYFGVKDYADVFLQLETRPGKEWAEQYAEDPRRDRRSEAPAGKGGRPRGAPAEALPPVHRQPLVKQFTTLCRRYVSVIAADRGYLAMLVALPIVLAVFARIVPNDEGLAVVQQGRNGTARQVLLVVIIGAALMGAATALREIVKERAIYLRERSIGLSVGAYLLSKVAVLSAIVGLQAIVLTVLSLAGKSLPERGAVSGSPLLEIVVAVTGLALVSAALGLAISAVVDNSDRAMPLLVLVTMAELVLCGGLIPVAGRAVLEQIATVLPARWAFAATASTVDLDGLERSRDPDGYWEHSGATWTGDFVVLVVLGVAAIIVVGLLIRRLDRRPG